MGAQITYVPVSGASTIAVTFATMGTGITDFEANRETVAAQAVSIGGKAYAYALDNYFVATCRMRGAYFPRDASAALSDSVAMEWSQFLAWVSWAQRGGEFTFAVDSANTWSTLMNGAQAQADQNIQVDSDTGAAADEWVYFEDANDPTIWEYQKIDSVTTNELVLASPGLVNSYADDSIARYHEYFPACVLTPLGQTIVRERPGGEGAYIVDLEFTFRTVR